MYNLKKKKKRAHLHNLLPPKDGKIKCHGRVSWAGAQPRRRKLEDLWQETQTGWSSLSRGRATSPPDLSPLTPSCTTKAPLPLRPPIPILPSCHEQIPGTALCPRCLCLRKQPCSPLPPLPPLTLLIPLFISIVTRQ